MKRGKKKKDEEEKEDEMERVNIVGGKEEKNERKEGKK